MKGHLVSLQVALEPEWLLFATADWTLKSPDVYDVEMFPEIGGLVSGSPACRFREKKHLILSPPPKNKN